MLGCEPRWPGGGHACKQQAQKKGIDPQNVIGIQLIVLVKKGLQGNRLLTEGGQHWAAWIQQAGRPPASLMLADRQQLV